MKLKAMCSMCQIAYKIKKAHFVSQIFRSFHIYIYIYIYSVARYKVIYIYIYIYIYITGYITILNIKYFFAIYITVWEIQESLPWSLGKIAK